MMITVNPWVDLVLQDMPTSEAWQAVFSRLLPLAMEGTSPVELHNRTVAPDRLLAESAWELWEGYHANAPKTSRALQTWWKSPSSTGSAVLILDACSLREMPALLAGAEAHGVTPEKIMVTGAEVPADTNTFAQALGVSSRSSLANNTTPGGFVFGVEQTYTDVLSHPFEDCLGSIPPQPKLFIWHTFIDELLHQQSMTPDQLSQQSKLLLHSDGFWKFIDRMRQGRRLVVTADHGYANAKAFSTEERDPELVAALSQTFSASRYKKTETPWSHHVMPPPVISANKYQVVIGQRKWKVQGGFPVLCHGGMSLLEVAVPFVVFPPK